MSQIEVRKSDNTYIFESREYRIIHESQSLELGYVEIQKKIEQYVDKLKKYELKHGKYTDIIEEKKGKINKAFAIGVYTILLTIISGVTFGISFAKSYRHFVNKGVLITKNYSEKTDEEKIKLFEEKLLIIKPYYKKIKEVMNE